MSTQAAKLPIERTSGASQGPFSAWQGMTLGTWIRFIAMRPAMDWQHAGRIAICTGCSLSNSVHRVLERLIYGRKIDKVQLVGPPVFILGHWRSGTTHLHNLLANDPRYVTPNTYEILNPHHFLLTESVVTKLTAWMLPKTRPMDNMEFTWNSPQEDETALLNLTLSSPYLMAAFQGQPEYYQRYFDMRNIPPAELSRWKSAFMYFVKKLTLKSGRRMLLKSPAHTFRIPILLDLFPDAQFVNIVRNPYAVFSSTMHMRRKMFEANGLAARREWDMEEEVCKTYTDLFEKYHEDKKLIPAGRLHEIRYESLDRDPVGELQKLYTHFNWQGFDELRTSLEPQLSGMRDYQKNEFHMAPDLKRRLFGRFRSIFERYNYASELDNSTSETKFASTGGPANLALPDVQ